MVLTAFYAEKVSPLLLKLRDVPYFKGCDVFLASQPAECIRFLGGWSGLLECGAKNIFVLDGDNIPTGFGDTVAFFTDHFIAFDHQAVSRVLSMNSYSRCLIFTTVNEHMHLRAIPEPDEDCFSDLLKTVQEALDPTSSIPDDADDDTEADSDSMVSVYYFPLHGFITGTDTCIAPALNELYPFWSSREQIPRTVCVNAAHSFVGMLQCQFGLRVESLFAMGAISHAVAHEIVSSHALGPPVNEFTEGYEAGTGCAVVLLDRSIDIESALKHHDDSYAKLYGGRLLRPPSAPHADVCGVVSPATTAATSSNLSHTPNTPHTPDPSEAFEVASMPQRTASLADSVTNRQAAELLDSLILSSTAEVLKFTQKLLVDVAARAHVSLKGVKLTSDPTPSRISNLVSRIMKKGPLSSDALPVVSVSTLFAAALTAGKGNDKRLGWEELSKQEGIIAHVASEDDASAVSSTLCDILRSAGKRMTSSEIAALVVYTYCVLCTRSDAGVTGLDGDEEEKVVRGVVEALGGENEETHKRAEQIVACARQAGELQTHFLRLHRLSNQESSSSVVLSVVSSIIKGKDIRELENIPLSQLRNLFRSGLSRLGLKQVPRPFDEETVVVAVLGGVTPFEIQHVRTRCQELLTARGQSSGVETTNRVRNVVISSGCILSATALSDALVASVAR
eukprot:Rmarinus@m.549